MNITKKNNDDDVVVPDRQMLIDKKFKVEKDRAFDRFIELIHKLFDPSGGSQLAIEAQRPNPERTARVYQLQQEHRKRIIFKHSNDESFHGLPDYLDSFKYVNDNRAQE